MTIDTEQKSESFIPKELVIKCSMLVEECHKELGWQRLPARVATKTNMVALACIDDRILSALRDTSNVWKIQIACWLAVVCLVILSWLFSWWILLGLIVLVAVERTLAKMERRRWIFMSSMLLSLEILANDMAGWGTAYPEQRLRAVELLGPQPTEWLDFYLPRRSNIDAATMKRFGPGGLGTGDNWS